MAFEHSFAGPTQAGAIHLKALLDRAVIAQVLATEPRRIARARGLLVLGASMLRPRGSAGDE